MGFKLTASKQTEEVLDRIAISANLSWPILVKLSMAMSLRHDPLLPIEMTTDSRGKELGRQQVTGDSDALWKCLMEVHAGKHLSDDEFFPEYCKAHLDRGAIYLDQEFRYSNDLLSHLTELQNSI